MKINKLIEILNIQNCKGISLQYPQLRKHPSIYSSGNTIYYYENDSVEDIFQYDEEYLEQIGNFKKIIKCFKNNHEKKFYAYVICEILLAKEKNDTSNYIFDQKKIENYLNKIDAFISNNLTFDISDEHLINCIRNDCLYRNLCFLVTEISYNKEERYRGMYFLKDKKFKFGNIHYYLNTDVVKITVYNDRTELFFERTGKTAVYEKPTNQPYSLPGCILRVLDKWKSFYQD